MLIEMDSDMFSSHISALQVLHERSTYLPSQLNELSLRSPQFHYELEKLARQLENLPNITRQTIAWINAAGDIPSKLAIKDVNEISEHCNKAIDRIGEISAIIQYQFDSDLDETYPADTLLKKEMTYLACFFDAMVLTMNVMMHAFHIARNIAEGAYVIAYSPFDCR
jgi:hypothetical protein